MPSARFFQKLQFPTCLVMLAGTALSFAVAAWIYQQEEAHRQAFFDGRARSRAVALDKGINEAVTDLEDVSQLFAVLKGQVSRTQFQRFARSVRERHPYIEALGYRRMLSAADLPAFEARLRREVPGASVREEADGKFVPAQKAERYAVIDYVEPMHTPDNRVGINVWHRPDQRDQMQRAAASGRATGSGLTRLLKEQHGHGIRILMPVYRDGVMPADVSAREPAVIGYTIAVLFPHVLIDQVFKSVAGPSGNSGLQMDVYAGPTPNEKALAYRSSGPVADSASGPLVSSWEADPWMERPWMAGPWDASRWFLTRLKPFTQTFNVAGVPWHVVINSTPVPFISVHRTALVALLLGLLLSAAGALYSRSLFLRTHRIQQLVAKRTEELRCVNELLSHDIKVRTQAEEALRHSQAQLRELAKHQEKLKEDERKRIARDIHDELGQNLMALRIALVLTEAHPEASEQIKNMLGSAIGQIDTTIKSVRSIINHLRPSVLDLGLCAALEWQAGEFERRSGIPCELNVSAVESQLEEEQAITLFRVVQESLTNVARHAQASVVRIKMEQQRDQLLLEISDNGIGLPQSLPRNAHSYGLVGIQERMHALKGKCSIHSTPGAGTTLALAMPL